MSSTSIRIYATRSSLVGSVKWVGGNASYQLIRHWAGKHVERGSEGELYLQTDDGVELVPIGNHIMFDGKRFYNFTPEDFEQLYVKIAD